MALMGNGHYVMSKFIGNGRLLVVAATAVVMAVAVVMGMVSDSVVVVVGGSISDGHGVIGQSEGNVGVADGGGNIGGDGDGDV